MKDISIPGIIIAAVVVIGVIVGALWGVPTYRVWSSEMRGRADLAEAEFNKQILVVEAEALLEVERFNAQAEIERARGAAQAMYEVQDALSEMYIRYLWVRMMAGNENIIYIPTEGSLPILEAGHRPAS